MLDQQRLRFLSTIDDLPDDDADVAAFLARVWLDRLAPTAIKQDVRGLDASGRRVLSLAHDRGEVTNALLCICPAQ